MHIIVKNYAVAKHGGSYPASILSMLLRRVSFSCVAFCHIFSLFLALPALAQTVAKSPQIKLVATLDHPQTARLSWSADGRYLATSGLAGVAKKGLFEKNIDLPTLAVWDVASRKLIQAYPRRGALTFVALIGNAPQIMGALHTAPGWNAGVAFSIWDARTGELHKHVAGPASADDPEAYIKNQPRSFSYSSSTNRLIVRHGRDNAVFVYNTVDWSREAVALPGLLPHSLTFSPDGSRLAFGVQSRQEIIEFSTGRQIASFHPFDIPSVSTAWSPDGRKIAFIKGAIGGIKASAPSDIKVWDAATGQVLHEYGGDFSGSTLASQTIAWSFDGRFIATSTSDRMIRLWHADRPELAAEVSREYSKASGLAFSPTANLLAIASYAAVQVFQIN